MAKQESTLVRIVVSIDPAVSANEDSDETGIIVAGRDTAGIAWVLDDLSCKASPDTWARRAVQGYWHYRADRIVAEVNNGGDLVENTIRIVDRNVSYKAVHASRGKLIRAEPVAALYERRLVRHARPFPILEDQLSSWVPGMKSPDRMDALVWALTDLLVDGAGTVQVYAFDLTGPKPRLITDDPTSMTKDERFVRGLPLITTEEALATDETLPQCVRCNRNEYAHDSGAKCRGFSLDPRDTMTPEQRYELGLE